MTEEIKIEKITIEDKCNPFESKPSRDRREYRKEYYQKHGEKQREYFHEYYEKNKERMREYARDKKREKAGGIRPTGRPRKNAPNNGFIQKYVEAESIMIQDNTSVV